MTGRPITFLPFAGPPIAFPLFTGPAPGPAGCASVHVAPAGERLKSFVSP